MAEITESAPPQQQEIEYCYTCKKEVTGIPLITKAFETTFHPDCFKCVKCKIELKGSFYPAEGFDKQGVCPECYKSADICAKCKKPLLFGYLSALNKNWHHPCLVCIACKKELRNLQIFNVHDQPVCSNCISLYLIYI